MSQRSNCLNRSGHKLSPKFRELAYQLVRVGVPISLVASVLSVSRTNVRRLFRVRAGGRS